MASLFSSLMGGAPKQSTGARLLERLTTATQLEDKREALDEFKELSTVEPLRLIEKGGMSVLLALLRTDDTQLTRDSLETLTNLLDTEVPKGMAEAAQVAAMHNAGIFLTNATNVGVVLNAIDGEENDMYVRFYAVQLLMKLLAVAPAQTQDAVLSQPAVVSRVMQLMEDRREIVRNEVLLLLAELSKGNADLQNILAFQVRRGRGPAPLPNPRAPLPLVSIC
jgi:hypothetical protein